MDVAHPGSHLGRLADELLLEIIEQPCLSALDLISLALTNRRFYKITISAAYMAHVQDQGGLAIYWAIQNEEQGTLERLVENGVDVNMRDPDGYTLEVDDLFRVYGLHETKAHVKLPWNACFSPLVWAAKHGVDSMVEYLLDHGADIEQEATDLCGCYDELLRCPKSFPDPPDFYERVREDEQDRLDHCGGQGDCSECSDEDSAAWKPLHYALCNRHESTAQLLLERGANADNIGGRVTALNAAIRWDMEDTIEYLLVEKSVNVNVNATGYDHIKALHMAHVARNKSLVDDLIERGADINAALPQYMGSWTVFAMACADGDVDLAMDYLRKGADPLVKVTEDCFDKAPWTVMRLLYGPRDNPYMEPDSPEELEKKMELERAIITGVSEDSSDT